MLVGEGGRRWRQAGLRAEMEVSVANCALHVAMHAMRMLWLGRALQAGGMTRAQLQARASAHLTCCDNAVTSSGQDEMHAELHAA